MKTGIDALSFYTPRYYLDLVTLAEARGVDSDKYCVGLGQQHMAVCPPDEDVITMAATAALPLLRNGVGDAIDTIFFATETGTDQSKAAGIYVHSLLDLPSRCRVVELKQACYSSTAALQIACALLRQKPDSKILVLASDIARYGLGTRGEPTQGCGAIAMLVTTEPRLLEIEAESGYYTADVMDFWRPNYKDEAVVDGHFSTKVYLSSLMETWRGYEKASGLSFGDVTRFCYHLPFTRMATKAHHLLARHTGNDQLPDETLDAQIADSLHYNRVTGNSYAASLYEGLTSLLDKSSEDLTGKRIGLFSYGSGCVAEFFSGLVQTGYTDHIRRGAHEKLLSDRVKLSCDEYEAFYSFRLPQDGSDLNVPQNLTGPFRLGRVSEHKRIYQKVG